MAWSSTDPELVASWLSMDATKRTTVCYSCGSPDHMSTDCPLRPHNSRSSGSHCPVCNTSGHTARDHPQLSTDKRTQAQPRPEDDKYCRQYNRRGFCFRGSRCPYYHSCSQCNGAIQSVPAPSRPADPLPMSSHAPHTPIRLQVFARFLTSHPDSNFVSKLVQPLTDGFNIGYHGPRSPPNLASSFQHPHVINEALSKEVAKM